MTVAIVTHWPVRILPFTRGKVDKAHPVLVNLLEKVKVTAIN